MLDKNKVVVAMSGSGQFCMCILVEKQGYEVVGMTMQIWQDAPYETQLKEGGCCSSSGIDTTCS